MEKKNLFDALHAMGVVAEHPYKDFDLVGALGICRMRDRYGRFLPYPGDIWRHFKGTYYRIVGIAMHTETEETMVIYHEAWKPMGLYCRPMEMFMSPVDSKKYPYMAQKWRFERMVNND